MIHYNKAIPYQARIVINGREETVTLSFDVIKRYFQYMELLGFVNSVHYEFTSVRPESLDPPDRIAAEILKHVIQLVDRDDPDVNQIIKQELLRLLPENERKIVLNWDDPQTFI